MTTAKKCPTCSRVYDERDGHQCPEGTREVAHARRTDPDTSHDAAAAATRNLRASQREVLRAFGGGVSSGATLTDKELVAALERRDTKQSRSGIRTRRKELEDAGLLECIGKRKIDGRNCRVYRRADP